MSGKPIQIDSQIRELNRSYCSCTECDSIGCFTKRRQCAEKCTCDKCKSSKTCLFYSNRMADVDSKSEVKVTEEQGNDPAAPCVTNELFEEEVMFDDATKTKITVQKHSKYSFQKLPAPKSKQDDLNKSVTISDRPLSLVHSVTVVRTDISSPTAKLSAQIMNVPYNDFKRSISFHKPDGTPKANKLSKLDILNRIKEAYNACSCKVCECIDSITLPESLSSQKEICSCKPCQCEECQRVKMKIQCSDKHKGIKGCSCIRCAKEKCRTALTRDLTEGCDSSVTKPCDCQPCQCIECRFMGIQNPRTIIVAPVGEDTPRGVCQCAPCDCLECGHVYGTINTSLTHEMSTGINRNRNCRCETCLNEACDQEGTDTCRCEGSDKIMRKPVQRDTNDYDIRSAIISNYNQSNQGSSRSRNRDTIAMYAAMSNTYPNAGAGHKISNTDNCRCSVCQCEQCKYDNDTTRASEKPNNITLNRSPKPQNLIDSCKCDPCECQVCVTNRDKNFIDTVERGKNCRCEFCECIQCVDATPSCSTKPGVISRPINKFPSQGVCKCVPCECLDCQKAGDHPTCRYNIDDTDCDEGVYPIKKSEDLNLFKSNALHAHGYISHRLLSNKENLQKFSLNKSMYDSNNSDHDLLIYQTQNSYMNSLVEQPSRRQLLDGNAGEDAVKHTKSNEEHINQDARLPCSNQSDDQVKTENISSQVSGSYISAVSSSALFVNNSGSMSPSIRRTKKSSWQSSCNSSGHDHSDYLIRFPRTPAETCINEVMKLNLDRKFNLNKIDVTSKANSVMDHIKSPIAINCQNRKFCRTKFSIESNNYKASEQAFHNKECAYICSGNACDCNPCDCDRCSFSKLKLKRCKCDCIACNCYGACLSEDQSVYIRKNEGTQTCLKLPQDRGQDSFHANNSYPFNNTLITNNPLYSYYPNSRLEMSKNGNNTILHQSDYSYPTNPHINRSGRCCSWNYVHRTPEHYVQNDLDYVSLPVHINYESVHNTIREAREFSSQLLKILEKYEKANREFESVSQKLKVSHESLFGDISTRGSENVQVARAENENNTNTVETNDVKTHKVETSQLQMLSTNDVCKFVFESNNSNVLQQQSQLLSNNNMTIDKLSSYIFEEVCKKLFKGAEELEMKNKYKKYSKLIKRATKVTKRFNSNNLITESTSNIDHDASRIYDNEPQKDQQFKDSENSVPKRHTDDYKRQNPAENSIKKEYTNAVISDIETTKTVCGRKEKSNHNSINSENPSHTAAVITESSGLSKAMKLLATIFGNTDIVSSKHRLLIERHVDSNALAEKDTSGLQAKKPMEENEEFPITKKNFSLNTLPCTKNKGVAIFPLLQLDIKEAIESISVQTKNSQSNDETVTNPNYKNKALANLHVEVKNLLNMPQLQCQQNEATKESEVVVTSMSHKTKADLEAKVSLNVASSQTCRETKETVDKEVVCTHGAHSMARLQRQIKDFMNIPTLASASKTRIKSMDVANAGEENKLASAKSSCDALKISFQAVRRISDHTILVKWNPPKVTKDIQGYELLVDGRAVQKVLSPGRCMAVVTCLPHNDHVLLTVRSITPTVARTGHYPSTTIVYRPRVK